VGRCAVAVEHAGSAQQKVWIAGRGISRCFPGRRIRKACGPVCCRRLGTPCLIRSPQQHRLLTILLRQKAPGFKEQLPLMAQVPFWLKHRGGPQQKLLIVLRSAGAHRLGVVPFRYGFSPMERQRPVALARKGGSRAGLRLLWSASGCSGSPWFGH
jgi:hypothetical protein